MAGVQQSFLVPQEHQRQRLKWFQPLLVQLVNSLIRVAFGRAFLAMGPKPVPAHVGAVM